MPGAETYIFESLTEDTTISAVYSNGIALDPTIKFDWTTYTDGASPEISITVSNATTKKLKMN